MPSDVAPVSADRRLPEKAQAAVFAGAVARADFSGAQFRGFEFRGALVEDSIFDKADCRDIYVASSSFARCSFRSVNFTDGFLGLGWNKPTSHFESVDFAGSRFVHVNSHNASYRACRFLDVLIRKSEFSSHFRDCTFSGRLDDVEFYGLDVRAQGRPRNEMADVSFRGASLRWVGFKKIDLAHVTLPAEDHIVFHHAPCVLPTAIDRLRDDPLPAHRGLCGLLEYSLQWLEGDIVVMHRLDAGDGNEVDARWAEEFLRRIETECGTRSAAKL